VTAPSSPVERSTGFYAPELDGLRAVAVGLVLVSHFSPTLARLADWGSFGVRLFFVLSGFLITHLLLRARERIDTGTGAVGGELGVFFVRRIFRLWPVFFAALIGAYALKIELTRDTFFWHALFASNHLVFHLQSWPGQLSHFWTLAVEQQFYFVWPFVVLVVPLGRLPWVLVGMCLAGPAFRALVLFSHFSEPSFAHILLPGCLDLFGLGGAIAWAWRHGRLGHLLSVKNLRLLLLAFGLWLALGALLKPSEMPSYFWCVADTTVQSVGFAALLVFLLRTPGGRLAGFLRSRPLAYLGRISYGIYIYHNFMHRIGPSVLRRLTGENYFSSEPAHVLFLVSLTLVFAVVSFHFFEEPVRKLGRRLL